MCETEGGVELISASPGISNTSFEGGASSDVTRDYNCSRPESHFADGGFNRVFEDLYLSNIFTVQLTEKVGVHRLIYSMFYLVII